MAQAPFTIVRPIEGSRVREVVKILIPKNSVPNGGYISVSVNGQFIEATLPQVKGEMYEYLLDTKKRNLKDGPVTIEVTLYGPTAGDRTAIIDKSKVNVILSNGANIKISSGGLKMRYKMRVGTTWNYDIHRTISLLTISSEEQKKGGTPAEQVVSDDDYMSRFTVDNVYPGGNGLLRIEVIPNPIYGTVVFQEPDGNLEVIRDDELTPLYTEITPYGKSVFFSLPLGIGGPAGRHVAIPEDVTPLPIDPQKVGEKWSTTIKLPGDFSQASGVKSKSQLQMLDRQVTGELVALEWEQGHPCAHIRYEFKLGKIEGEKVKYNNSIVNDAAYSYRQDAWYAIDLGTIVRRDEAIELEGIAGDAPQANAGGGAAGAGVAPGPGGVPSSSGGGGVGAGTGAVGLPQGGPGRGGRGGRGGQMGNEPGGGGQNPGAAGLPEGRIRVVLRQSMILRQ